MSSTTYVEPKPPPPPQTISESGQTSISLNEMFGPTVQRRVADTLESLSSNFDEFVEHELGLSPNDEQSERLRWRKTAEGPGAVREYSRTLQGSTLPAELRSDGVDRMNVQIMVGGGVLRVRHDYLASVPADRVRQTEQRLRNTLTRIVARTVNPVIAAAVSQALRQNAEQKLRSESRLKQEERLKTRVRQNLNYQTTGFVRTAYSA